MGEGTKWTVKHVVNNLSKRRKINFIAVENAEKRWKWSEGVGKQERGMLMLVS